MFDEQRKVNTISSLRKKVNNTFSVVATVFLIRLCVLYTEYAWMNGNTGNIFCVAPSVRKHSLQEYTTRNTFDTTMVVSARREKYSGNSMKIS